MSIQSPGGSRLLVSITGVLLLLIVAVPFSFILLQAIFPALAQGAFDAPFRPLIGILNDPALGRLSGNTLLLGLGVVTLSALIAIPLGVLRALFKLPLALYWDLLLLVPFMIPPYIATLGWIMTLQPRGYLEQLLGSHLGGWLFSPLGIVFVMTLNTFPLVYFAVSRTLEAVGAHYTDVGRVHGASPAKAFWRITLPLATPGLCASLLLVFSSAIEEYGTPMALGRYANFDVLVIGIDLRVSDWPIDLPGAASLSLVLVSMSLAAFLLQRWIITRRSYVITTGKPQSTHKRSLGVLAPWVTLLFGLVALITTGIPILAILVTALSTTLSAGLVASNFGFTHFIALAGGGGFKALSNSLIFGVSAALLTGMLGALSAYVTVKTRFRGRAALDVLTVLPNALPAVVVAVGLILAWNQPRLPFTPYNTPLILLLAYCCILLPQPVRYATAAFHQLGDNLEAAARVCGASAFTTFRRIMLPLIFPSLMIAMLLVFAVATRELVASLLVAPVGMQTISVFIWRQFDQGSVGQGMAMALITILVSTLLPLILIGIMRRRTGSAPHSVLKSTTED